MEATRPALHGDLEVGYADVLAKHQVREAAHHNPPPQWLINWEDNRPRLLVECFAEFFAVFLYVFCGVGASAAFFLTTQAKLVGYGSLLTIGLSYGIGIILAIVVGFPGKKVPFYIASQIFGAFIGALCVYGVYKQQFDAVSSAMIAGGEAAVIFTPQGPGGVLALFTNPGQDLGYVFLNEFIVNIILTICVFSILDSSNVFVTFASAPFLIGLAYAVCIWAFAPDSLALNTARDLGGRFACAAIYGRGAFPSGYTAIACLTNILSTFVGAAIQVAFLSDSARPTVSVLPDPDGPSMRVLTRDTSNMRALSRGEDKPAVYSTSKSSQ